MGKFIYLRNVVTLELAEERCIGCGMCLVVCPHGVFRLQEGKAAIAERDGCMECGACMMNCPVSAIAVDRGVGCAQAVLNAMFGRTGDHCCSVARAEDGASSDNGRDACC